VMMLHVFLRSFERTHWQSPYRPPTSWHLPGTALAAVIFNGLVPQATTQRARGVRTGPNLKHHGSHYGFVDNGVVFSK
jgi:hypothetical protein